MATIVVDPKMEQELQALLRPLPAQVGRSMEVLVHAWMTVEGSVRVGDRTIRLLVRERPPRTAATLHLDRKGQGPVLEIGRVVLEQDGMDPTVWDDWCDERPELASSGFDPGAKYPIVRLEGLSEPATLRLALGLRDLWFAATRRAQP